MKDKILNALYQLALACTDKITSAPKAPTQKQLIKAWKIINENDQHAKNNS